MSAMINTGHIRYKLVKTSMKRFQNPDSSSLKSVAHWMLQIIYLVSDMDFKMNICLSPITSHCNICICFVSRIYHQIQPFRESFLQKNNVIRNNFTKHLHTHIYMRTRIYRCNG